MVAPCDVARKSSVWDENENVVALLLHDEVDGFLEWGQSLWFVPPVLRKENRRLSILIYRRRHHLSLGVSFPELFTPSMPLQSRRPPYNSRNVPGRVWCHRETCQVPVSVEPHYSVWTRFSALEVLFLIGVALMLSTFCGQVGFQNSVL